MRKKAQESASVREDVLSHLEFWSSEIYEEAVFNAGRAQVSEQLRDVFVGQSTTGLEFYDELIVYEQIGGKLTEQGSIIIENVERVLLDYEQALLPKPMEKSILVHFLHVPMPEVGLQREARLSNLITKLEYGVFHTPSFLRLLRVFAAKICRA